MIQTHKHAFINENLMRDNLIEILSGHIYNHDEILSLCDNIYKKSIGLTYFDIWFLKLVTEKLAKKLGRKLNILEIGCGTTSRAMTNLGHNVKTYALSDDHASAFLDVEHARFHDVNITSDYQKYQFTNLNVFNNRELLQKEFSECDFFFLDGDHTFDFATFIYEKIVLSSENKKPILCHDFLPFLHPHTWGEQVYLITEFFQKQTNYKLVTHTSQPMDTMELIAAKTNSKFLDNFNKGIPHAPLISCLALIN